MRAAEPLPSDVAALRDRLDKRARHLKRWAEREGTNAYRLFDRDIPGWHFAVDLYDRFAVVAEYPWKEGDALHASRRTALADALVELCGVAREDMIVKAHVRHSAGEGRYGKSGDDRLAVVSEGPLAFEVNLGPYLDVGLFLDQRTVRRWVRERCRGRSVANLFCYTGSFSVAAAAGGARQVVSVDLSPTYLAWAKRNFARNRLALAGHAFVEGDALEWIGDAAGGKFDLVICDPPPASASKRGRRFDVQLDHERMLLALAARLNPGGAVYFACNLGGFELSPKIAEALPCRELTPGSLPEDFRRRPTHRAWLLGDPWLVTG